MAHNYDINKGIYPDEPGYKEWTGFEEQCKIPGTTFKKYRPIHPLKFHEELLKKRLLKLKRGETYTDLKTRCHVELHRNQRYFQPKGWSVEKLLYNYDLFYHFGNQAEKVNDELTDLLKEHCEFIYKKYRVNIKDRIPHG